MDVIECRGKAMTVDLKDLRAKQEGVVELLTDALMLSQQNKLSTRDKAQLTERIRRSIKLLSDTCNALPELLDMVEDAEYRYECLKSLYEDEMNYSATGDQAEQDVDDFIAEEQSHS